MQKWEYLRTDDLTIEELNQLGEDGWELVIAYHFVPQNMWTYTFKREKSTPAQPNIRFFDEG